MRYSSIDVLRTFAIMVMIVVHFLENLSGTRDWSPDGFGAPLFALLTGVSYRLWLAVQESRHKADETILKITIRRGLFLFGLGFVFNVFVWLPEDIFIWDVLNFIGTALIVLGFVRHLPQPVLILLIGLSLAISQPLQTLADYPAYWTTGYFECDLTLSDVLLGFLVTGYFPLFPWIAFPMCGYLIGSSIFTDPVPSTERLRAIIITSTILIAVSLAALLLGWYGPSSLKTHGLRGWSMFPASWVYLAGTLGMAQLALLVAHRLIDRPANRDSQNRILSIAGTFSRYSLSIYVLHHIVHLWPLWIYGLTAQDDPTHFLGKAFPFAMSFTLAGLFIVCCYFLLHWIEKTRKPTIESFMRWICDD